MGTHRIIVYDVIYRLFYRFFPLNKSDGGTTHYDTQIIIMRFEKSALKNNAVHRQITWSGRTDRPMDARTDGQSDTDA